MSAQQVITQHLDIWTAAHKTRSSAGRGSSNKLDLYGIKKLRELILELAVRGKLVPQDAKDEPAIELLKKIRDEKANLIKNAAIRKDRDFPLIADDEHFFHLPAGWAWARLEDVGRDWGQKTPEGTFTYIDVSAIDNTLGKIVEPTILSAEDAPSRARKIVVKGTVIYSTIRPYLQNIAVIENDFSPEAIVSTAFAILHPLLEMPAKYFSYYLRSPAFIKYVESVQTGIAYPAINDKQFYSGVVPIPPLAEQHRIVTKVDELMAFCDQLEQTQSDNIAAHAQLVEALLATLTNSSDHNELQNNWQRIAAHFNTLFTTEHSIDQLKQTILQLAIMGKLVPQDPNDEPASELLKKIAAEKAQLIKEGKIKKQKILPPITEEKSFELPVGWELVRLQDITNLITDGKHGDCDNEPESGFYFLSAKDIQDGQLIYDRARQIVQSEFQEVHQRTNLEALDICMVNTGATVGKIAIATDNEFTNKTTFQKSVAVIKPTKPYVSTFYLANYLISETPNLLKKSGGSAINNLLLGDLKEKVLSLPPIEEQHRIVAKVDELMALCDALKTNLQNAQTTQLALADALVEQAVS